jgi:hypothetical protein
MKVFNVMGQSKIFANADGTVSVSDLKDLNGEAKKFEEIGPLLFRETNGQDLIGFKRDADQKLTLVTDFPPFVFQQATLLQNSMFNIPLIVSSMVVMTLALLIWPISIFTRRHYDRKIGMEGMDRRLWIVVRIVCAIDLIFLGSYAIFFSMAEKDISIVSPASDPLLRLIQVVGWLGCIGALVALYNAVRAWKTPGRWVWSKISETAICLACLGFLCFVFYWNMLHWSLRY